MRSYAIKKGLFNPKNQAHHPATIYSDRFDRQVDFGMRKTLETKTKRILDSWLSGFMAQGVKGTLKILIFCKDKSVLVDRLANRDNLTVNQAKKHIFERETKNVEKWRRMYTSEWQNWIVKRKVLKAKKPIWFWYPELYDLTIDTYKNSKQETLRIALKALGINNPRVNYEQVFSES